ncbi:hypothetical protein E3T24_13855 [Cryobacterium sp. TmT2-59]|uniref:Uncharacterized protein n=1 Tax=Cryobacterium shii TaxID=1259235 RepID=A0AAQ2HF14_9MICO|nr:MULTISPECIES: hypothetical protein [Cryobacterium]TFC44892.1 hypothetical protein E3O49_11340 [Cryobacterium shii]TFC82131.1 hypothetical protein E3T24_13855 [Cryobacterium sp. TmT2-59]
MDEAAQREPGPHINSGNQTMGHVKESTEPTAVPRFPEFDGTFDPDLAEIILSEPSRYPATLLHAADKRVNEKTCLQPLAAVAEKGEWFSLPD